MKKITATILTIVSLVLFPTDSKADLDLLSIVQDRLGDAMSQVDSMVKQYTGIQFNLQEISLNRDVISQLNSNLKDGLKSRFMEFYGDVKNMAEAEAAMFLKSSLSNVTLPGIGSTVDLGAYVSPKTKVAVGQKYLKKQHKNDDVRYNVQQDLRINNLMIDNVSTLFANSLVRRKQIIDEDPCSCVDETSANCQGKKEQCEEQEKEFSEMSDVNTVKRKYYEVSLNAYHRWLKIQEVQTSYIKLKAEQAINTRSVDNVGEIVGEEEKPTETEAEPEPTKAQIQELKDSHKSPYDLSEIIQKGLENIKNGNYGSLASDVLGGAGNAAGMQGADTWSDVLKDVLEGNTSGALDTLADSYDEKQKQHQAEQDAAAAQQKQLEEQLKETMENMQKELEQKRQEECKKCNDENEARQKAGEPMQSCFSVCTF